MVGAALIHFILVELRALIAAGVSTLSIGATMFKQTYNSEVGCICMPGCTQQETYDQTNRLLQNALTTFGSTFNATSKCASVEIQLNFDYGPWFYYFFLASWILVFSTCVVLFFVEACKQRFSSIQSGAYLVFTLQLEQGKIYRLMIRAYIFCLCVGFIAGIVVILFQSKMNFHLMWTIAQREILPFLILLLMSLHLLSPANLKEFSAWDIAKLRQIHFRRSCCSVFLDSNDALYHRIGVATLEAARGNFDYLNALVARHGDRYTLMQALGLPFDWSSLKPSETSVVPGEKFGNYIVEVKSCKEPGNTKRSL